MTKKNALNEKQKETWEHRQEIYKDVKKKKKKRNREIYNRTEWE